MKNVAILTTVANFDLYYKTNPMFDCKYDRYVIDGKDGMHGIHSLLYMMKKFKNLNYDYIIMADEDFILKSNKTVVDLIAEMKKKKITIAGVRDGGVIHHRNYNPFCINTFFSIINLKRVKEIWNKKEVLQNQKIGINEFMLEVVLPFEFNEKSLYEPYYCFYLWLLRKGEKIKYLTSKSLNINNDQITNVVLDDNSNIIGFHSWYARSYGIHKLHTDRINVLLDGLKHNETVKFVLWQNATFKYIQYWVKFLKKVKIKIK
tara:strand:+ start:307 stop:1089 length:783 start_codon:yes stop_codon:yes gene_type:complete